MSMEEFTAGLGDFVRDGLAYLEAQARNDDQAMDAILAHADPRTLVAGVAAVAEQCAIQGAILGGAVSASAPGDEQLAARDEVLRRVRQQYEQSGLA